MAPIFLQYLSKSSTTIVLEFNGYRYYCALIMTLSFVDAVSFGRDDDKYCKKMIFEHMSRSPNTIRGIMTCDNH